MREDCLTVQQATRRGKAELRSDCFGHNFIPVALVSRLRADADGTLSFVRAVGGMRYGDSCKFYGISRHVIKLLLFAPRTC